MNERYTGDALNVIFVESFWRSAHFQLERLLLNYSQSLNFLAGYKNSLLSDMDSMRVNDGCDDWRQKEIKDLGELVQGRLD